MASAKRWSKSFLILPVLLAINSAVARAETIIENFRLKGDTAFAEFEATDPQNSCLLNFVSVFASDLVQKSSPGGTKTGSSPGTVVLAIQRDICNDIVLFDAVGGPSAHLFQVAGDVRSATLSAELLLLDAVSRNFFSFQVNLTFDAIAPAEFLHSKETFKDANLVIRIMSQSVRFTAQARATGTVFGLGQNLTPEASDVAAIQSQNDGTLNIQLAH